MIDASIPLSGKTGGDPFKDALSQLHELRNSNLRHQVLEQQLAQGQRAQEEAQALRGIYGSAEGADLVQQLNKAGYPGQASAYQKQLDEQQSRKLDLHGKIGGLLKQELEAAYQDPTEANIIGRINRLQDLTGQNMDHEKARVFEARNNPDALRKYVAGHILSLKEQLPAVETKDIGGELQTRQVNPLTGEVTVTGTTPKTQSPDSLASNELTRQGHQIQIRGQNMTADTARQNREATANTASEKLAAKQLQGESSGAYFETAVDSLNRLKDHKALGQAVGVRSMFPTIPGSGAADFEAQLDTFKAQTFVPMVAALKGMGALSDAEGKKLADAVGALSLKQSKEDFIASANRIQKDLENAYKRTTGKDMPGKTLNSMPDPAKMPGALIEADDGTRYRSNGAKWMRE